MVKEINKKLTQNPAWRFNHTIIFVNKENAKFLDF